MCISHLCTVRNQLSLPFYVLYICITSEMPFSAPIQLQGTLIPRLWNCKGPMSNTTFRIGARKFPFQLNMDNGRNTGGPCVTYAVRQRQVLECKHTQKCPKKNCTEEIPLYSSASSCRYIDGRHVTAHRCFLKGPDCDRTLMTGKMETTILCSNTSLGEIATKFCFWKLGHLLLNIVRDISCQKKEVKLRKYFTARLKLY